MAHVLAFNLELKIGYLSWRFCDVRCKHAATITTGTRLAGLLERIENWWLQNANGGIANGEAQVDVFRVGTVELAHRDQDAPAIGERDLVRRQVLHDLAKLALIARDGRWHVLGNPYLELQALLFATGIRTSSTLCDSSASEKSESTFCSIRASMVEISRTSSTSAIANATMAGGYWNFSAARRSAGLKQLTGEVVTVPTAIGDPTARMRLLRESSQNQASGRM